MSKIYFAVVRASDVGSAVLDLENLPPGVTSSIVKHAYGHAEDIGKYLNADIDRTYGLLQELAVGSLTESSQLFFSEVASFWENLPPQTDGEEKDGVFMSIGGGKITSETHFIRTSAEVALETFRKVRAIDDR